MERVLAGKIERIGLSQTRLTVNEAGTTAGNTQLIEARDHAACLPLIFDLLKKKPGCGKVSAIGHRVVHGGALYQKPQRVDDAMLAELRRLSPFDPEHLPAEIALMEAIMTQFPGVPQIACFDTGFHHGRTTVTQRFGLPDDLFKGGVRR